jgi:hypothetical protein
MSDDKIISFEKALAARQRASEAADDEAAVKASTDLERMLIDAVKVWLQKPKTAEEMRFNAEDWASVIFYGGAYFIRRWTTWVDELEATDSETRALVKKLQALLSERGA